MTCCRASQAYSCSAQVEPRRTPTVLPRNQTVFFRRKGASRRFVCCDYGSLMVGWLELRALGRRRLAMVQLANGNEVVTPTKADAALAKELGEKLAAHEGSELRLELKTGNSTEELVLPPPA